MRKIEKEMLNAANSRCDFSSSNTQVKCYDGEIHVFLHGNEIYKYIKSETYFTMSGWNTNVTRSRLRALGVPVARRKRVTGVLSIPSGKFHAIDKKAWYKLSDFIDKE